MTEPTRWEQLGTERSGFYLDRFSRLIAEGTDIEGEARLADALLPREGSPSRVLDAGAGMGRVGAALAARGHDVTTVEKDPVLVAESHRRYPALPTVTSDLAALTPELLAAQGRPERYDLIVCVGNVMLYLAEGSERAVLGRLAALLAPEGRLLVGFGLVGGPPAARASYPAAEFVADAAAAGLRVELHAGTYDLRPPTADYGVFVLGSSDPNQVG